MARELIAFALAGSAAVPRTQLAQSVLRDREHDGLPTRIGMLPDEADFVTEELGLQRAFGRRDTWESTRNMHDLDSVWNA